MRQGDGAELLGSGDPRSASIGVIHVAPTDDRQSVLAAILTQEKLGRKQVAVVLPEHNRAFRQSVDFDGLKGMRRTMKADIVFIAPSGPGPADFARQRRFQVYSSLENYIKSFQDGPQDAGGQRPGVRRKSRFFGGKEKSAAAAGTPPMIVEADPQTPQTPYPVSMPQEEEQGGGHGHAGDVAIGAGAGLVAGAGLEALASRPAPALSAGEGSRRDAPLYPHAGDEDLETMPPAQPVASNAANNVPGAITNTPPVAPAGPADQGMRPGDAADAEDTMIMGAGAGTGPGIIQFPQSQSRGRTTGKLPIADMSTDQQMVSPPPARQRTSGKIPVVGAAALGAGAGAGAVMAGRGAVGAPPPVRRNVGGGPGPAGPGNRRRRPWWMLALIALLLLSLLLCAALAYAKPSILGSFGKALPIGVTTATVTITPKSVDLKNQYLITGVTGTPDATRRQVQARQFSANPGSQSQTVNATGHAQTPGANAGGMIRFTNGLTVSQVVLPGTTFNVGNLTVITDAPARIPPANPPVSFGVTSVHAHVTATGTAGNIGEGTINKTCCSSNAITAYNFRFSGGQDPQNYTFVQQSDIDGAANPIKSVLSQKAQQQFQAQIRPNEQLVGPAQCNSRVSSDHNAGDHANTVTVTVSASCTGEAYDHLGALAMAQTLLRTEAASNPGAGYALAGALQTSITQASVIDANKGTVQLTVPAEGIWVYQIDDAKKQQLAKLIAGKTKAEAARLLQQQEGIQKADIQIDHGDGNTLPTDAANITIVVQNVPGLQGTPTPGGPGGTPPPTPITTAVPTSTGGPGNNQSPTPGLGGS
ncbi:MAG: hypothetical protein M3Y81_18745 [Chloroflexota bacterium]|nr:hypothetical protein [Chloroflexota bacterium]